MISHWKRLGVMTVVFGLAACSSSKTEDTAWTEDEAIPVVDAGTDAMPTEDPEPLAASEQSPTEDPTASYNPEPAPEATTEAEAMPPDTAAVDPYAAPAEAPVSEPTENTYASTTSGDMMDYRVQPGDTLMKIAFETYGNVYDWKKIRDANSGVVADFNRIPPGTVLKVERPAYPVTIDRNGEKYLIKVGDTLGTISRDVYGTDTKWKRLWENNRQLIRDPNRIYAGFHLYYLPEDGSPQQLGNKATTLDSGWEQSTNTTTPLAPEAQEESRYPSSGN